MIPTLSFYKNSKAFTLIELLVVITVIGVLLALSLIGLQTARESSRDTKRKSDLELVRSGIELYRADCGDYPASLGASLVGDGTPTTCAATNTYIQAVPGDPQTPTRAYRYSQITSTSYELCASLEQTGLAAVTCGGSSVCGNSTCNYKTTQP